MRNQTGCGGNKKNFRYGIDDMKDNKYARLYKQALIEMFSRVGVNVKSFKGVKAYEKKHGEKWFNTKNWTREQKDDFRDWLIERLRKVGMTKKRATREAGMFVLMYGWPTKE